MPSKKWLASLIRLTCWGLAAYIQGDEGHQVIAGLMWFLSGWETSEFIEKLSKGE